jgi:hypothetical protein
MVHWTDDPVFDHALEIFDGRRFYGDDWRRLQRLREDAPIARVIPPGRSVRSQKRSGTCRPYRAHTRS